MTKLDLSSSEVGDYYIRYIDKLSDTTDLKQGFTSDKITLIEFFKSIPKEKLTHRYQPEKWSIKEVLQHLIDTERIFMYRCFRVARRDKTALAGFDQEIYINPSGANQKSIDNLLNEFILTRNYSISLLQSLSSNDLTSIGNFNGEARSARTAAFTVLGHNIWHMEILQKKYL